MRKPYSGAIQHLVSGRDLCIQSGRTEIVVSAWRSPNRSIRHSYSTINLHCLIVLIYLVNPPFLYQDPFEPPKRGCFSLTPVSPDRGCNIPKSNKPEMHGWVHPPTDSTNSCLGFTVVCTCAGAALERQRELEIDFRRNLSIAGTYQFPPLQRS